MLHVSNSPDISYHESLTETESMCQVSLLRVPRIGLVLWG